MRLLVFFDLPMITGEEKREYRKFRKLLITNGFIMLQESVYCKLLTTPTVEQSMKNLIKKNKPPEGKVQMLLVTEKQFSKMDYIIGENSSNIIDSDDTLIIL
ncbi:MAG: CRISPR-associated endonuclease Cas2 [Anaerovoracaceae bacterium]|nr:CRISPR-associated endonuclease Cas2 [Anaerovoracaceae bacterium]